MPSEFESHLAKMWLGVQDIKGDGNCLFRALVHQLHPHDTLQVLPQNHQTMRHEICSYIQNNADYFAPFIPEPVDRYLRNMRMDGTYGGNVELVACSRLFDVDLVIYQDDLHVFRISPPSDSKEKKTERPVLRLVYRSFEHYDSIIVLDASKVDLAVEEPNKEAVLPWQLNIVIKSTGATDLEARNALLKTRDVGLAIELLLDPLKTEEATQEEDIIEKLADPVNNGPSLAKPTTRKKTASERKDEAKREKRRNKTKQSQNNTFPRQEGSTSNEKNTKETSSSKVKMLEI